MELEYRNDVIYLEKELNHLDRFVMDFVAILEESSVPYVLVSGYVAILFGRNRSSEDIDIFMGHLDRNAFAVLWERLSTSFECVITSDMEDAYDNYLAGGLALRFAEKGSFIPNVELKFPVSRPARWALENRQKVVLNETALYISPVELQIAYKLFLGGEKDIEDAKYLHVLFQERLNETVLHHFIAGFNQNDRFRRYIDEPPQNRP